MIKVTVGAIILKDRQVLLTKRNVEPFKNCWCIPGGHIEYGESAKEAVKREVKEETWLDFEPEFFDYFDEFIPEINWHAVVLVFRGKFCGEIKINDEVLDYSWFSEEEIKNLKFAFKNKEILEKYFDINFS
jgi:8-oxo-dGTP diphosphatase